MIYNICLMYKMSFEFQIDLYLNSELPILDDNILQQP